MLTRPLFFCEGKLAEQPIIRSENGSGFISREFGDVLSRHELIHYRIKPHSPEENGLVERCNLSLREAIDEHDLNGRYEAEQVNNGIVQHCTNERLHSTLGYQTRATWCHGKPDELRSRRGLKLSQARHLRKQINPCIRQRTVPLTSTESTTYS